MTASQTDASISVITPVLNGAKFIDRCIENVVDQSIGNMEHILVDGGSTDGTIERIKTAADKYQHIRFIEAPGSSQGDSMNRGISAATGHVLGTLNVDDFYGEGTLKEVAHLFCSLEEPAFLVGNCKLLECEDRVTYTSRPTDLSMAKLSLCGLRKHCFPLNPSSYFYHRSLHAKVGMYDVDLPYTLDVDFLLRAIPRARFKYVDRDWGNFRLLPGTKTYQDYVTTLNGPERVRPTILKHIRRLPIGQRLPVELLYQVYFLGFRVWRQYQRLRATSFWRRYCSRA